jgi:FkbM family methyltransferase
MSGSIAAAYSSVLKDAFALHQTGKLDEAASLYRKILKQYPRNADALYLLGVMELQKADPLAAIEWIDRAIAIRPDNAEFFYNLGRALRDLKRFEDALASYDRALELRPDYAEALNNRGVVLGDLKRFDDALASYDRALELRPDYAEALNNRGVALEGLKSLDDALASYDRALATRPDYPEALNNRSVVLVALKRFDDALASCDRALALLPNYPDALYNRGNALRNLKRFDDALASYDRALALKPYYPVALNNRGVVLGALKRFDDALASYDHALALLPDYAEALNNRGGALEDLKRFDDALASYDRALALKPDYPEALNNRGVALGALKRSDEALASYDRALALLPDYPEALNNRGVALEGLKRFDEALVSFERALAIKPDYSKALNNRGIALEDLKRFEDALASYDAALALLPDYAEALNNRGNALRNLKRFDDALASYGHALVIKPDYAEALNNLALALQDMKRFDDALASYDRALAIRPDYADAFNNLGLTLADLNRPDEALASYDRALALQPDHANALNNRGNAFRDKKRLDEAIASYDRAIAFKPDFAEVIYNRGMSRLLGGDFRKGWPDYEYRWGLKDAPVKPHEIDAPEWRGEDMEGRSILVYIEQGLGDGIQFARYLPLLVQRGARVSFYVPAQLTRLFRPLAGIELISSLKARKSFDFQCALISLPLWFGTDLESIPNQVPYLEPEEGLARRWKQIIGDTGFKIGIAWQGNPQGKADRGRSFPLSELASLSRLPGVRLISLQKHHGLDQLAGLPVGTMVETLSGGFDNGPDAFIDTAAIMSNLDLIITSDTSIAHLAGALGRPTWVALKYVPDWRWLLDRQDCPWYPTARLFRQKTAGDWRSVFSAMEQELSSALGLGNIQRPMKEASPNLEPVEETVPDRRPLMEHANLRLKRCKHGAMMFYANDEYIGRSLDLYGEFSEGEMELFNDYLRSGMTVVDVGANIGVHTVYFANAVGPSGHVFAFEPQRILHQILCGNVALNQHGNVVALNAGLGAQSGTILVPRIDYARNANFGGLSLGKWERGEEVPLRTLDSCAPEACHLIKIDVEGMELAVLEGAKAVLDEHKPLLYVENDRAENSKALIAWLLNRDYRLYWHMPRMFNAKNYFGETQNVFGNIISINMLCITGTVAASVNGLREITSPEDQWRAAAKSTD